MKINYYKLSDLCVDIIDCPHSTPIWKESGVRVVRNFNLKDGNLDFSNGFYVDESTYQDRIKRAMPEQDDIIISREAPMGVVAIIPKDLKCCLGQRLVLLKVDKSKIAPFYLLSILRSEYVQTQFRRADVTGSTVSNLCIPDLKNIIIPVVEINQSQNAKLLKNINEKIVVNSKINDNLAQQAKLLYDYWFTQFDFPDENDKPYRSSGGQMVWNDLLKKKIPLGWEVKTLSELLKKNTQSFDYSSVQPTIDLSVMPSDSIALSQTNSSDNFSTNLYVMKKGDILFGSIRPYLHKAGIAPCDGAVAGTVHSYHTINPNDYNFSLLTMARDSFFDYAVNTSSGTKMPVVSSDSILSFKFAYSKEVAKKFNSVPIMEIITRNVQETQRLIKLRDFLLPLLMNGQATIAE